jgi:hypothetical protein
MGGDGAARGSRGAERARLPLPARVVLVVALAAVTGFAGWAFFFGTTLQLDVSDVAVLLLVLAAGVVAGVVKRDARWFAVGLLLMSSYQLVRDLAVEHRWRAGQLEAVSLCRHWVAVAALGCFLLGALTGIRSGAWRSERSAVQAAGERSA